MLLLFSLSFAYVSHHICLVAAAASPLYPFLSLLALLVLIPMVMGLLSPRGSQITTTIVAGIGFAIIMTRERCLLALSFFFCFFDQGIGSRSAAWASRVDIVWVSVYDSSVVGCCSCMLYCCIRVALYASCMYPHLLCNVDVMISTLQKRFNMRVYPWWDLRVPFG